MELTTDISNVGNSNFDKVTGSFSLTDILQPYLLQPQLRAQVVLRQRLERKKGIDAIGKA